MVLKYYKKLRSCSTLEPGTWTCVSAYGSAVAAPIGDFFLLRNTRRKKKKSDLVKGNHEVEKVNPKEKNEPRLTKSYVPPCSALIQDCDVFFFRGTV